MAICHPDTIDWGCALTQQEIDSMDPDVKARSEALAWSTLVRLTGYRLALCPVTIRPCAARCLPGIWMDASVAGQYSPYVHQGNWYNACGCSHSAACSCTVVNEVVLRGEVSGPIVVTIDGVVLDPSAYRLDNGNRLVRQDGESWPLCQDMNLPAGDPGTFTVSYYPGVGPDDNLSYAAGILAVEWYKACTGQHCRLPEGTTNVARLGITMTIPTGAFEGGMSGIREVDAITGIYNPHRLITPSVILSPNRRPRQRTY
jgi:hypothetical protein